MITAEMIELSWVGFVLLLGLCCWRNLVTAGLAYFRRRSIKEDPTSRFVVMQNLGE